MGACRSADDKVTGKKVAIKKVSNLFYDSECAVKVLRETKLITRLRHENVRSRPPPCARAVHVQSIPYGLSKCY